MKKFITIGTIAVSLLFAGSALAAANPSGTGQPNQSCQAQPASPPGLNTPGFLSATLVYAGALGSHSADNANSAKAVSQYDVACFQVSQK